MCAEGRPDETPLGDRIFAGEVSDAYLQRADVQRGYTIVIWRGRHVAEPTGLSDDEAAAYWLEVLRVGRAIEAHLRPVKLNYDLLGTRCRTCTRTWCLATRTTRARAGRSRSRTTRRRRSTRRSTRPTRARSARS